ncbi:putative 40S ribosomal protein S7 [Plasmodium gaboni]|uniref:40S ribosomal protein S7 n=1 Tax=Plasmodium gaboni TaxID=647221 RepID=A0A151LCY2_9APIC|nr:putative 40S ribosomal protein S7 [Plasmodium gaboni]KYN96830.1 putative 40S ribosomal protein S7 [Plasmodium gaboni]SOV17181.1 40S ribosomal protein S7, putative [Plasmodium gaboni]SOV24082.1 40S ribosomal protein S7, putative [Plasmodium sp. DRC-Itaito]
MDAVQKRVLKSNPSDLEKEIAQCLLDIELSSSSDIKTDAKEIKLLSCDLIEVEKLKKKTILIYIPYKIYTTYVKKIQRKLINELEKKTKKYVVLVAKRTILKGKQKNKSFKIIPRSRTLTSVYDSVLEDIVSPSEIIGKRISMKADGKRVFKIMLDSKERQRDNIEEKLISFAAVYKKITRRDAVFSLPPTNDK